MSSKKQNLENGLNETTEAIESMRSNHDFIAAMKVGFDSETGKGKLVPVTRETIEANQSEDYYDLDTLVSLEESFKTKLGIA